MGRRRKRTGKLARSGNAQVPPRRRGEPARRWPRRQYRRPSGACASPRTGSAPVGGSGSVRTASSGPSATPFSMTRNLSRGVDSAPARLPARNREGATTASAVSTIRRANGAMRGQSTQWNSATDRLTRCDRLQVKEGARGGKIDMHDFGLESSAEGFQLRAQRLDDRAVLCRQRVSEAKAADQAARPPPLLVPGRGWSDWRRWRPCVRGRGVRRRDCASGPAHRRARASSRCSGKGSASCFPSPAAAGRLACAGSDLRVQRQVARFGQVRQSGGSSNRATGRGAR